MGTKFTESRHTAAVSPFLQPLPIAPTRVQGVWVESTKASYSCLLFAPLWNQIIRERGKDKEDQRKRQSQEGLAL